MSIKHRKSSTREQVFSFRTTKDTLDQLRVIADTCHRTMGLQAHHFIQEGLARCAKDDGEATPVSEVSNGTGIVSATGVRQR